MQRVSWFARAGDPTPAIDAKVTVSGRTVGSVVAVEMQRNGDYLISAELDDTVNVGAPGTFSFATVEPAPLPGESDVDAVVRYLKEPIGGPRPMRLADIGPWIRTQLDPDIRLLAKDKAEHALGCFAGVWFFSLLFGLLFWVTGTAVPLAVTLALAFFATMAFAVGLELGQWDIARHVPGFHAALDLDAAPVADTLPATFLPGFGFGLLDLAAGALGGLSFVILRLIIG